MDSSSPTQKPVLATKENSDDILGALANRQASLMNNRQAEGPKSLTSIKSSPSTHKVRGPSGSNVIKPDYNPNRNLNKNGEYKTTPVLTSKYLLDAYRASNYKKGMKQEITRDQLSSDFKDGGSGSGPNDIVLNMNHSGVAGVSDNFGSRKIYKHDTNPNIFYQEWN